MCPGLSSIATRAFSSGLFHYAEILAESEIVTPVGLRGLSCGNAMVETLNSVYQADLIEWSEGSWVIEVMGQRRRSGSLGSSNRGYIQRLTTAFRAMRILIGPTSPRLDLRRSKQPVCWWKRLPDKPSDGATFE